MLIAFVDSVRMARLVAVVLMVVAFVNVVYMSVMLVLVAFVDSVRCYHFLTLLNFVWVATVYVGNVTDDTI